MGEVELKHAEGLAYREAGPDADGAPAALLVHGYPQSSYMWRDLLGAIADAGWRAVAPDMEGFGDSPPFREGTWERHVDSLERFRQAVGLDPVVLIVHDWGGLIGLRWACEHPDAVFGLVLSNTGFFPDGKWHGMGKTLRTEGEGEQALENMTKELFATTLQRSAPGIDDAAVDEYWKAFADGQRRQGQLDLYRSGDFEKIERYQPQLRALDVPALIFWGAEDQFAPVAGAYRFQQELSNTKLSVVEGCGHFVFEDAPERAASEVTAFLTELSATG